MQNYGIHSKRDLNLILKLKTGKVSLDVIQASTTSLLSQRYVRGASLDWKMRLPPAGTVREKS